MVLNEKITTKLLLQVLTDLFAILESTESTHHPEPKQDSWKFCPTTWAGLPHYIAREKEVTFRKRKWGNRPGWLPLPQLKQLVTCDWPVAHSKSRFRSVHTSSWVAAHDVLRNIWAKVNTGREAALDPRIPFNTGLDKPKATLAANFFFKF